MTSKTIIAGAIATTFITGTALTYAASETTETNKNHPRGMMKNLTDEQKAQFESIKTILEKKKAGETLTDAEEAQLAEFKASMPERGNRGRNLTDEEKTALEAMNDEEKKEFFETKRAEREEKRAEIQALRAKVEAGETLTDAEKETLDAAREARGGRMGAKMQNLTDEEREAMKAERAEMKAIFDKKQAGESLTEAEQAKLDKMKEMRGGKMRG